MGTSRFVRAVLEFRYCQGYLPKPCRLWSICGHHPGLNLHNYLGEHIRFQASVQPLFGAYSYNGHRAEIHQVLYNYAESLGVQINLGKEVVSCWEDEERGVNRKIAASANTKQAKQGKKQTRK